MPPSKPSIAAGIAASLLVVALPVAAAATTIVAQGTLPEYVFPDGLRCYLVNAVIEFVDDGATFSLTSQFTAPGNFMSFPCNTRLPQRSGVFTNVVPTFGAPVVGTLWQADSIERSGDTITIRAEIDDGGPQQCAFERLVVAATRVTYTQRAYLSTDHCATASSIRFDLTGELTRVS